MAVYVGEGVTVRGELTDPDTEQPISAGVGMVEVFAVGKNPARNPADREVEYGPFAATYDEDAQRWIAYLDTGGWAPGERYVRMTVTDSYPTWEYTKIKLLA